MFIRRCVIHGVRSRGTTTTTTTNQLSCSPLTMMKIRLINERFLRSYQFEISACGSLWHFSALINRLTERVSLFVRYRFGPVWSSIDDESRAKISEKKLRIEREKVIKERRRSFSCCCSRLTRRKLIRTYLFSRRSLAKKFHWRKFFLSSLFSQLNVY